MNPNQVTQDDIIQNTRTVIQSLETLKHEHSNMIKTLVDKLENVKSDLNNRTIVEEEINLLKNSDEMVVLGISEASVLVQLSSYLQSIEAEKQKIKSQVKRLCHENAWLRDELAAAQKRLQESEQHVAQIEVEMSHLKFLKELKKFDEVQEVQPISSAPIDEFSQSGAEPPRKEGGYNDEEDDQNNPNCKPYFLAAFSF